MLDRRAMGAWMRRLRLEGTFPNQDGMQAMYPRDDGPGEAPSFATTTTTTTTTTRARSCTEPQASYASSTLRLSDSSTW